MPDFIAPFNPPKGCIKYTETPVVLRASAILTSTYVQTAIVDVTDARWLTIVIHGSAGAAANIPQMLIWFSNEANRPLTTDDVWTAPHSGDGSVSVAAPGGTAHAGEDATLVPESGIVVVRAGVIRLETSENATDEWRIRVPISVADARWVHLDCADVGGGTLTTLALWSIRSI